MYAQSVTTASMLTSGRNKKLKNGIERNDVDVEQQQQMSRILCILLIPLADNLLF